MKVTYLPRLPEGYKQGFTGIVNETLFVGMGSLGRKMYSLRLDEAHSEWQGMADFPFDDIDSPVSIVLGHSIWVFSGVTQGKMNNAIYQYNTETQCWTKLAGVSPIGLLGCTIAALSEHEIVFIGGYNEAVFNQITAQLQQATPENKSQILSAFLSQPIEAYQWNNQIWKFDTRSQDWSIIADNPYSATCGSARIVTNNELWVCDGEIKPGLRCKEIKAFRLNSDFNISRLLPSIVRLDREHEGVAGAFSGLVGDTPMICGGAYFIGSQENYRQGRLYSHQGLEKTYSQEIWAMQHDSWHMVDELPVGKAYGSSEQFNEGLLLIGGELSGGEASCDCVLIEPQDIA